MCALHVTRYALRAQHASIEREFLPGFEADDLVIANLQLNSTRLTAKTTMRLYKFVRGILGLALPASWRFKLQMGPIAFNKEGFINRRPCHAAPFSNVIALSPEISACRSGRSPA